MITAAFLIVYLGALTVTFVAETFVEIIRDVIGAARYVGRKLNDRRRRREVQGTHGQR